MIVNKLDACQYDAMKLVKETLSQINRSESRKDIAGGKKSRSRRHGLSTKKQKESTKVETIYFVAVIATNDLENFTIMNFKKNPCIPRKFSSNYNGKETAEENEILQSLTKEKVLAE